ncbi:hypothetical protein HK104_000482, partial [Borealophlyctis nickersoniae]
ALFYLTVILSDLYISIRIITLVSRTFNDLDTDLRTVSSLGTYIHPRSASNGSIVSSSKRVRIGKRGDVMRGLKRMVYVVCACDVVAVGVFLIGLKFPQHELEWTQFSAAAYVGHVLFGFAFLSKLRNAMGDSAAGVPETGNGVGSRWS